MVALLCCLMLGPSAPASGVTTPWVADTYFYWYTWDGPERLGSWTGGVYNTPSFGYYDSRSLADNVRELHTAAEWGLTHHFMDYWGPGWDGEGGEPREMTVMRAAEAVRERGYPIYMGVYQDGEDFEMAEFSRNLDPGRDAHFYLDLLARREAYPKLDGKPVALIYGRNGVPKASATDESFRAWLRDRHGDLATVNRRWGTSFTSWEEVRRDFGGGAARADSIRHQYQTWQDEWRRVDAAARERWGLPGFLASWDVGYQPFLGYGYEDQPRVFIGPHSYGGIFHTPQSQSAERFIQAAVAKAHGTVFFDTFKNFYHDWEIRVPGNCYPPDFDAFDRFWINVLLNKSEALLHLSWNEWWEGSNLEPCLEYGKTYCEKNLLWSSLMQQCFPSIQRWNDGAKVALILNDWHQLAGGTNQADIHGQLAALRRSGAVFDLVPDGLVSAQRLEQYNVVLAPAAGVGLGDNAAGQPILGLLRDWLAVSPGRRLILSRVPRGVDPVSGIDLGEWLKLRHQAPSGAPAANGDDMNLYVDVGAEGDDEFLVGGMTGREDWLRVPGENRDSSFTVRWTPGVGRTTLLVVPLSPGRDHVFRFGGAANWPSRVSVRLNGTEVGAATIEPGDHTYEAAIPAAAVGDATIGEISLVYDRQNVPGELDPARYPGEARVCNLALEFFQVATAGTPLRRENNFRRVEHTFRATADAPAWLRGRAFAMPYAQRDRLVGGSVMTTGGDGAARDMVCAVDGGQVWYCDGLLGTVTDADYLDGILAWAGVDGAIEVTGDDLNWSWLEAGDTTIVLVHNDAATEPRQVTVKLPAGELPLAEASLISRDGTAFGPALKPQREQRTTIEGYAAWQFVHSPVRVSVPPLDILAGETRTFAVTLENLTDRRAAGTLGLGWHLPSLTAEPVDFSLRPGETKRIELTLVARDDCDWGAKTIILEIAAQGRRAYLWRPLRVWKPAEPRLIESVVQGYAPRVTVEHPVDSAGPSLPATDIRIELPDQDIGGRCDDLDPGERAPATLARTGPSRAVLTSSTARISWRHRGRPYRRTVPLIIAWPAPAVPQLAGAERVAWIFNPHDIALDAAPVALPAGVAVRDSAGRLLPSRPTDRGTEALVNLPPRSRTLLYLVEPSDARAPDDLVVESRDLGSGRGEVTVSNSYLAVTWSEAAGGTVTSLRTRWNETEHAADNLGGLSFGRWGVYNPRDPVINTVNYVGAERKTKQTAAAGVLSVRDEGTRVVVTANWRSEGARARQTWIVPAFRPALELDAQAQLDTAPDAAEELVVADLNLRRGRWNKIFPNYTGVLNEVPDGGPHGGWREGPHVPPLAMLLAMPDWSDSLSAMVVEQAGLTHFRQGLWPANRPATGPIDFAELEYVARGGRRGAVKLQLSFLDGHTFAGDRERRARLDSPPLVTVETPRWEGRLTSAAPPGPGWWHAGWGHRVALILGPLAAPTRDLVAPLDERLGAMLPAGEALDPDSVRVLQQGRLIPARYDAERDELTVRLPGELPAGAEPRIEVYLDTVDHGPKEPPRWTLRMPGGGLSDAGFERGARGWELGGGVTWQPTAGRGGGGAVALRRVDGQGPILLQTASRVILPNTRYRLTFQAKTGDAGMVVRSNVYHPNHDPPQVEIPIVADRAWHEYRVELESGNFPPTMVLMLRLWIYDRVGEVLVDDVSLEPVGDVATSGVAVRPAEVG